MGKDEWQRTVEVLTKKREQSGYIVKVHYDADGIVNMIYLQTPSQRDMFCRLLAATDPSSSVATVAGSSSIVK